MAKSVADPVQQTKEKIRRWLLAEEWRVTEQKSPEAVWIFIAQRGPLTVQVGQTGKDKDKVGIRTHIKLSDMGRFTLLPLSKQEDVEHEVGTLLLVLGVGWSWSRTEASGQDDVIFLWRNIFLDALTRDLFMERFVQLCNAGGIVATSISRALTSIEPQEEAN